MQWHYVAAGYLIYLAVVSFARPEFASRRSAVLRGALVVAVFLAVDLAWSPGRAWSLVILPSLVLLASYRLSGLLFVRVDTRCESWLCASDEWLLTRPGIRRAFARAPLFVAEYFELSYMLVYAALPAGAVLLVVTGHHTTAAQYWTVVLLAESLCYGMLPWVQTRPPMLLETTPHRVRHGAARRLNQFIAARGSIHANTIPSGHAAGALASALVIWSVLPGAGLAFLWLAVSIATASVLGRYHYAIDSVLGFAVALAVWLALGM